MIPSRTSHPAAETPLSALRWGIAFLISAAIAISYLDRQTLPWAIEAINADIPISNQAKATLDSAFLATYGFMYLGGGWLLDRLGTRRGFLLVMIFWSLACAAHGLAGGLLALGACRLLLGMGEGGGFPAATRAVAEWFPVRERATAMGIINGGTAVGAVAAPPLIALVLTQVHWLGLAPWRWVFFLTGSFGLGWAFWWWAVYSPPREDAGGAGSEAWKKPVIQLRELLRFREIWAVAGAKFLSDATWYFYLFWLPKYLLAARHFDIKHAGAVGWIPYAASGVGCLCGGGLSSGLLRRGGSVNFSRKWALAASAALMPWVMFIPSLPDVGWVLAIFSLAFFGQQSWSTLIMVLPTDLVPKEAVGKVAGLVGFGGAMGGVVLGQLAGYLLDHGFTYTPILCIAASLHIAAFIMICLVIPVLQPLRFAAKYPG
ncbi:MAG: MFS transporter [Verrucomicrobiota bacterium]|jgi:ACS family hexuronate transporter-like MFS transporter